MKKIQILVEDGVWKQVAQAALDQRKSMKRLVLEALEGAGVIKGAAVDNEKGRYLKEGQVQARKVFTGAYTK